MRRIVKLLCRRAADELQGLTVRSRIVRMHMAFGAGEDRQMMLVDRMRVRQRVGVHELGAGRPLPVSGKTKTQHIIFGDPVDRALYGNNERTPIRSSPAQLLYRRFAQEG